MNTEDFILNSVYTAEVGESDHDIETAFQDNSSIATGEHNIDSSPDLNGRAGSKMAITTTSASGPEKSATDVSYNVRDLERRISVYEEEKCCSVYRVLEVLFLAVVVMVLLVLYMIPTIYFVNPPLEFIPVGILLTNFSNCSSSTPYSGEVCRQELSGSCLSNSSLEVTISDPESLEQILAVLLNSGHPAFGPSPECDMAFRSFICLHHFGACDANSSVLATRATCRDVRDRLCEREWREISRFLGPGGLPVCEDLPESGGNTIVNECTAMNSSDIPMCNGPSCQTAETPFNTTPLNCSELFYFSASQGLCVPLCGWGPHMDQLSVVTTSFIGISADVLLLLFSTINLVSGLTVQRQVMLKFPTIYFFLLNIDTLALGITFTVIRSFPELICADPDYITNNFISESVFCDVVGILFAYIILQSSYLIFFYSAILFWSTNFPFRYRESKANEKLKYIFIVTMIVVCTLPLLPLILLKDGYFMSNFLLQFCTARNPTYVYVVLTLHLSLLYWLMTSMFILIIWKIFKDLIVNRGITVGAKKTCGSAEFAEVKLLAILIYSILTTIIALTIDSYTVTVTPDLYISALFPYFVCESTGYDENKDCNRLLSEVQQPQLYDLSVAFRMLLGMLPVVIFLFSTDFKIYMKFIKTVYLKLRGSRSRDLRTK